MVRYIRLVRNISNWGLHFAVKLGFPHSEPLIFKTRNNIIIEVPKRLHHEFKEIFMEGCYSRGISAEVPDKPVITTNLFLGMATSTFFKLFSLAPLMMM